MAANRKPGHNTPADLSALAVGGSIPIDLSVLGDPPPDHPLTTWWLALAREEATGAAAKAEEYGSFDLELIGWVMARFAEAGIPQYAPVELGLAFYLLGKVARVFGALIAGSSPSDDTYTDIGVYTRMIQRYRETGRWP